MAISVFTNVSSLNAQRNLNTNSASLSKALQRLSSGLRINTASDDAAGMAISNGLKSQISGLNQAVRNAGDGLSLLGTADSAISGQTDLLQRMRELAVQASSDTNSNDNRNSLNSEAAQLKSELDRIAKTTQFNGNNLLDGTFLAKDLQVGAYSTANDRISLTITSTRAAQLGMAYTSTGGAVDGVHALSSGDVTITVGTVVTTIGASASDGVSTVNATMSALSFANAINAQTNTTGVTAEASNSVTGASAQTAGTIADGDFVINGVSVGAVTLGGASDQGLVAAINAKVAQTGVTATLDSTNHVVLTAADGRNITVADANTTFSGWATGTVTTYGSLTLSSTNGFTVGGAHPAYAGLTAGAATQSTSNNVNTLDLTTKSKALLAIKIVDVAMNQLNSNRANIGALTNRLNSAIANLTAASENASAANSRITDADFASETAAMSRSQILQQAGVAVLAQANQAPQLALSLLR